MGNNLTADVNYEMSTYFNSSSTGFVILTQGSSKYNFPGNLSLDTNNPHLCISYASQEPWIFGDTIRDNMFGQSYDRARYTQVANVCALTKDFRQFPQGDMTMVGDRGVSLSGGQRVRINLARAVYRQADVYLLDDLLSAVDTRVARHLYGKCITEYLHGKTRILVTHQLQFLKRSDHIVVLDRGFVKMQGNYNELVQSNKDFIGMLDNLNQAERKKEDMRRASEMSKRITITGQISRLSTTSSIACSAVRVMVPILQSSIITYFINDPNAKHKISTNEVMMYITFLVITNVIAIMFISLICYNNDITWITRNTLLEIQKKNIFQRQQSKYYRQKKVSIVTKKVTTLQVMHYFPTLFMNPCTCLIKFFLERENSFFLVGKSLLCINLLSNNCILFYGIVESICNFISLKTVYYCIRNVKNDKKITFFSFYPHLHKILTNYANSANIIMFSAKDLRNIYYSNVAGSKAGLAISLILIVCLQYTIKQFSESVSLTTSVERILQYTNLSKEEPITSDNPPPPTWPSQGQLILKDVNMKYHMDDPPVLKNLNVSIEPGWKVGVVGRTGAGKSFLISALFRLFNEGLILNLRLIESKLFQIKSDCTDALIQNTIRSSFKECTVITIAYRLNTIIDSNRIIVMENGSIVLLHDKPTGYFSQMVEKTGNEMAQSLLEQAKKACEKNNDHCELNLSPQNTECESDTTLTEQTTL
ncbi:Multidrug resistance-associated protein 4 [Trachymyrmex septentrionalis]|uniref:Multidrug resistance-associated protein 4 n=1 Tax=Trachymyrmex septentrionalis TaxID=34720 RepID=A0A151JVF3_9HYME|nr:Multidrug resistance-associated protein 4 [Trachymyrmex septentrionalis]